MIRDILVCRDDAFFLQRSDGLGTELHLDLFTVDDDSLGLKIRLPYLLGVALGKADVTAKLLSFAGEFTFLHGNFLTFKVLF